MTTRFRFEQRFNAPVELVEAAFYDPELIARMAALPALGRPELLGVTEDGPVVTRQVRFAFTGQLSKAALAVLDPRRLTWVEESVLDRRTHRAQVVILPDHYADRLSCHGTLTYQPDGPGTLRVTEGELSVRVALVAGRVERAIASGLKDHAAAEESLVQEFLGQSA